MAFKQLPIETWGTYTPPQTSVRIKRQSDRKFYDVADGKFKPEAEVQNPWTALNVSTSSLSPSIVEAYVDMDPAQWTDGDYTVYFHDVSIPIKSIFSVCEVTIFDGDAASRKCPSATEIAGRILDGKVAAHKMPGTVGAWMLDVTTRIQAIQTKLGV